MLISIVDRIALAEAYNYLQSPDAGGVNVFVGTVRNHAQGKEVVKLLFEAYKPMAESEMRKIAVQASERWVLSRVVMQHVLGERRVGEAVVIVGVSAAHRDASFEACRFLIDSLKASVPIWKKEYYADSSIWIAAHP